MHADADGESFAWILDLRDSGAFSEEMTGPLQRTRSLTRREALAAVHSRTIDLEVAPYMSPSPANLHPSQTKAAARPSPKSRPLQSDHTQPAAKDEPTDALKAVLQSCRRRVRSWRVPPKWSRGDWLEEIEAVQEIAAWQAGCAYDPSSGIKYEAFAYQKVMAGALTRYRQEWSYALRFISTDECARCVRSSNGAPNSVGSAHRSEIPLWCTFLNTACPLNEDLNAALMTLSKGQKELIKDLFLHGSSESEIGKALGISQRAVSKRKHAILQLLRDQLSSKSRRPGANFKLGYSQYAFESIFG